MKAIAAMSLQELAAFVCSHLRQHDIPVVLVGGSCVSIYSDNRYQTADLDFVERYYTKRAALRQALAEIGFEEKNRYFVHPESAWFLEFPTGPLAVGDDPVHQLNEVELETGWPSPSVTTSVADEKLLGSMSSLNSRETVVTSLAVAPSAGHVCVMEGAVVSVLTLFTL